jgi:alpha-L-arabinofuranosidase
MIKTLGMKRLKRTLSILGIASMLTTSMITPAFAETNTTDSSPGSTAPVIQTISEDLLLHYTFDDASGTTVSDASLHGNDGVLVGGATWSSEGKLNGSVDLNGTNGHVKLPDNITSNLTDMTIAAWVKPDAIRTWARVFDFGTSDANWMFLTLRDGSAVRFSMLPQGRGETMLGGPAFPTSAVWHHVAVTLSGNTGVMYINGLEVARNEAMTNEPDYLGNTNQNFIGRSQFTADPYFDGKIDDFRIYRRGLTGDEVMSLITDTMSDAEKVAYAKNWLELGDTSMQIYDLTLPILGPAGTTIGWQSSHPEIVGIDGKVQRPAKGQGDREVTLTATITKGSVYDTKTFIVVVWEQDSAAYTLNIAADQPLHEVSPNLYGVFFEDINYAGDGGLYGELLQNRSFEFSTPLYSWTTVTQGGAVGQVNTSTVNPLNEKNPRYAQISITTPGAGVGLSNSGYSGLAVEAGEQYNFSLYARSTAVLTQPITAKLQNSSGTTLGSCSITGVNTQWQKLGCSITSNGTDGNAKLIVTALDTAVIDVDMVSLFPNKVWNNRTNGLRYDLAEMLDDIRPKFLRFPGGCIVEGGSVANHYDWDNTIGDVAERKTQRNQWASNYYQSFGLGYHEYFQLAEDLGAEPLPVVFIGIVSCANPPPTVPMNELQPYIDDALNLIEYANGDVSTAWGAKRAANGHPEPFNLKYLGVGNELWGPLYYERYNVFYDAIKAKYPDIKLVFSAGAFPADSSFYGAYEWLAKNGNKAQLVDEHMYQPPAWFYDNVNRYDDYSRTGPKVFVGEYAAHGTGKRNNIESALAEAAFMTGLERNSDVVELASFAPLFARENFTQWTTDLIWFNNRQVYGSPNYYVQKLFSNHVGQKVIQADLLKKNDVPYEVKGSIVLGTWTTAAEYDDVKVTSKDGAVLYSSDFSNPASMTEWNANGRGTWSIADGVMKQTMSSSTAAEDARLMLQQGKDWNNYTLELKARKSSGTEGFLIGFGAKDSDNYYWWNLGGFANTRTIIEKAVSGTKSTISNIDYTRIDTNRWYDIKIVVEGSTIRCYLDGVLIHEVDDSKIPGPVYSVTTKDEMTGDLIIKAVNISAIPQVTNIRINGESYIHPEATVFELKGSKVAENSFDQPEQVVPTSRKVSGVSSEFAYELPPNSVTVMRVRTKAGPAIEQLEPAAVTTAVGTPPQLPATVQAVFSDGSVSPVEVQWRRVDSEQYGKTGQFRLRGTVEGTYLDALAVVKVAEAATGEISASLSGPASVQAGETFEFIYSLNALPFQVYANDLTVHYDADKLTYEGAEGLINSFTVAGSSEDAASGKVRILLANAAVSNEVVGTKELLKLKFRANTADQSTESTIRLSDIVLAKANGEEVPLSGEVAVGVRIVVAEAIDKTALNRELAVAQALHAAAVEGTKPGQYPVGSKAVLQAAISAGEAAAASGTITQHEVDEALEQLLAAVQAFRSQLIVAKKGDLNEDGAFGVGDLALLAASYGKTSEDASWGSTYARMDMNGDGILNIIDLSAIARLIVSE